MCYQSNSIEDDLPIEWYCHFSVELLHLETVVDVKPWHIASLMRTAIRNLWVDFQHDQSFPNMVELQIDG